MSYTPPRYIYEDFKHWKGDWELLDGHAVAMAPSPFGKHQKLMSRLLRKIGEELEACECEIYPELDWIIDQSNVVRPDLAVYCEEVEEYPKVAPKLVVEIISTSTAQNDEEYKFDLYEREGVEYYILAYPNLQKVRIFHLQDGKYRKYYEGDGKCSFDLCDMEVDFRGVF